MKNSYANSLRSDTMSCTEARTIILTPALMAFVIFISVTALVILAVSYWYIFREDSTVLVTLSAALGTITGYILRLFMDLIRGGD